MGKEYKIKKHLTIGQLKKIIANLDDNLPVRISIDHEPELVYEASFVDKDDFFEDEIDDLLEDEGKDYLPFFQLSAF